MSKLEVFYKSLVKEKKNAINITSNNNNKKAINIIKLDKFYLTKNQKN